MNVIALVGGCLLSVCFVALSWAQVDESSSGESTSLAAMARRAESQFTPATEEQIAVARQETRQALNALSAQLSKAGENGAAWRQYALLDRLEAQLAAAKPETAVLHEVIDRLSRDHQGLESPPFRVLRSSLLHYTGALETQADSVEQDYQARLKELTELLAAAETEPDPETMQRIGEQLAWLEMHGQAPTLTAAIRERYGRPNFLFTVSQRVLDGVVEPFVSDDPFREVILNTPTYGQGLIKGHVRMKFAPSDSGAVIDMYLQAAGEADTVSVSGPVRVYSKGHIRLAATKRVLLTPEGLRVSQSRAKAKNRGETSGVATTLRGLAHRIVCRIAWRRVNQSGDAAEREANMKAERRLRRQFDAQAAEELDELAELYRTNVRLPLQQRRLFPSHVDLRTTADRMLLSVAQADSDQLAASLSPPRLTGESDLAVRLHESTVNNLALKLLAGKTVSLNEVVAEVEDLLDEEAEMDPSAERSDDDEIEITFDETAPITLRLDDSVVSLTIRGRRYEANGRVYPAMNVTIRYRVEMTPEGARVTLVDEPEIIPPRLVGTKGRFSFTELTVRRILKNRLERDLDKELGAAGFELPRDIFDLDELPIEQLAADDGWIVFSARVQPAHAAE